MSEFAILNDDNEVVSCNVEVWSQWIETNRDTKKRVAYDEINDVRISTVFLGMNHGWGGEKLWFETMVFGGPLDGEMDRYKTYSQAVEGHKSMVERARSA